MNEPVEQIRFDIETLIDECRPSSILCVGEGAHRFVETYVAQREVMQRPCAVTKMSETALHDLKQSQRYDVGIIVNTLEYLEKDDSNQLVARLRDLHTTRFVVLVRVGGDWEDLKSEWQVSDFLSFGMKLVNRYQIDGKPMHIYTYDISTYKKTPEWLNPKDWANPELWDKFRW